MSHSILVVEDEKVLREILVDYLITQGYKAIPAETGGRALEIISENSLDLVLLDVELPDMTGIDVLREAKQNYPELVFLILTGNQKEEIAKEAIVHGAFDYLVKPIDIEILNQKYIKQIFS